MIVYNAHDGSLVNKELFYCFEDIPSTLQELFPQPQTFELLPQFGHSSLRQDPISSPDHEHYNTYLPAQPCILAEDQLQLYLRNMVHPQLQPKTHTQRKPQPYVRGQLRLQKQRVIKPKTQGNNNVPLPKRFYWGNLVSIHRETARPEPVRLPPIAEMPAAALTPINIAGSLQKEHMRLLGGLADPNHGRLNPKP